ncbi:DUF2812 domain-containing protein [Siminovitchia acidinfaciens]|uniref:DUF2812 domain-containing protein n=1 Tax=Siminovitchia acidinfaciens TaxID=2321395 RepID=A0A429Y3T4_9BACI|nr:DUF2812 domain-containing protein [Siminovitchia acidinfaciens]RST76072.1 DUF2812 domain-containing protein [Siminovitchia acidinfaciens]
MVSTKYIMSYGLAFFEGKDMDKLRQKALKGWHLKRFRFAGYELEKGECEDVIFSIDYRTLQPDEKSEYFEMFSYAGWTHVCSSHDMHIFKAKKGAVPIYSDVESSRDKMVRLAKSLRIAVAFFVGSAVISWLMMTLTSGFVQNISKWAFQISYIFTIPAIMTYMATYYHKWKKGIDK